MTQHLLHSLSLTSPIQASRSSLRSLLVRTACCAAMGLAAAAPAHAEPQSLSATVAGKVFESDDDGITYVPLKSSFSISAGTKGYSKYPPPPGLSDRLSLNCTVFDGKPRRYSHEDFNNGRCHATFTKGVSKQAFGKPEAEYTGARKVGNGTFIEITRISGKVMEGRFAVDMLDEKGGKLAVTAGSFKVEDRQL